MANNCAFEDFYLLNGAQKDVSIHIDFSDGRKDLLLELPDLRTQSLRSDHPHMQCVHSSASDRYSGTH